MTIYYRYWAQIQELDMNQRVMISAGILSLLLFLVLKITYRLWKSGFYKVLMGLRIVWYLLISNFYYDTLVVMKKSDKGRRIREQQNLFSERSQNKYEKTKQAWQLLKDGKKKYSLFWGLVIYMILVSSILLPRYTKIYLPYLSDISFVYENIERKSLEMAQGYAPFWESEEPEDAVEVMTVEEAGQMTEKEHTEIWLQLSERGWNGSNIREEPNKNSGRVTTISGQIAMKQLELSEDGRWIRIELADGIQGWINHTLVEVME